MSHCLGVHLRDNKRHLRIHPKRRAIIHHDRTLLDSHRTELLADRSTCTEEGDVNPVKALWSELLHRILPVLKGKLLPSGAATGEEADVSVGEVAVREDAKELLAYSPRDTHNRDGEPVLPKAHAYGGSGWISKPDCGRFGEGMGNGERRGGERREEVVAVSRRCRLHSVDWRRRRKGA